jgi:hypothetical protein
LVINIDFLMLGPFEIKWAIVASLMFMQPPAHSNTIHTSKLWLMMPPKLQIISLPPYNISPTRVKRFTYVDKTIFVSKKLLQILGYSERANTWHPRLDRLWDAHGNNTTLCSLIIANIIENYNPSTHYLTNPLLNVVNFRGI